ncbi:MAG: hypothetical protein ACP5UH_00120 [Candidatus Micrarchaeia archaeon]
MIPISMFLFNAGFTSVKSMLMPLVLMALLLDSAFIALWYIIGALLGNPTVKAGATNEFYQLIGTAILIAIVVGSAYVIASTYISILNSTKLMNSNAITTMCNNINGYESTTSNPFNILGAYLGGNPSTGFSGLCSMVNLGSSPSLTAQLDYPLAATSVIMANLTNQSVADYNGAFLFDAWIGFLSKLSPQVNVCVYPGWVSPCVIPLYGTLSVPDFLLHVQFTPFSGYSMIYRLLTPLGTLMTTAVESFVAQLSINVIAIDVWPFLIFFGLLLRSVFFTRKIGGLLIAAALGFLVFLPAIYAMEYLSLANSSAYYNTAFGYSTVTSIPSNSVSSSTSTYTLNFFAMPSVQQALGHLGCMPPGDNLLEGEAEDVGVLLIPFYSVGAGLLSAAESGNVAPYFYLPAMCPPSSVMPATYMLFQIYGIMGVTAYFLPLINLMVTLSAVLGVSSLLGGDTELAGLARLV